MALKNKKAAWLLTGLTLGLLVVGALLYRWWAAGAVPPPPDDLFDNVQTARAIERLRASRLDQQPLIDLVESVRRHLQQAEAVPFSNPPEALAQAVRLEQDLARMEVAFERLLQETAAAGAPEWQERFVELAQRAAGAYREARDWSRVFSEDDLDRLGFRALLDKIVTGKDRAASLPAFPPWRGQEPFFREQYAAFEQAYRLRNEQQAETLRGHLLASHSAPLRWYFARLYEARLPTSVRICADLLLAEAERLKVLIDELAAADPLEALARWRFPQSRRSNLVALAELARPLEQATSLAAWVEVWSSLAPQREQLERAMQAAGSTPDPALLAMFTEVTSLVRSTALAYTRARETGQPEAWQAFVDYVRSALSDPAAPHCVLEPLQELTRAWNELQRAEERLLAVRGTDPPPAFSRAFADARLAAEAFSNAAGAELTEPLLAPLVDRWGAHRWAGWDEAGEYAERLREIVTLGLWPDPRLAALAAYLTLLSEASSSRVVREQMQQWSDHVRPSLVDYPLLRRRIEAALPVLRDQWMLTEMQTLIEARRDEDLRQYLEALGTGETPEDLRALSEAALTMLKLPERVDELNLEHLPHFAQRNASLLPAPPPPDSVLYPLYEQQVLPLLQLAEEIVRLPALPRPEVAAALERAIAQRDALANVYPHWHGFDEPLARATLGGAGALFLMEQDSLLDASRRVARLLAWDGIGETTRADLVNLQRLLAACVLFLGEDPCAPGFMDWVEQARTLQARFDLADTSLPALLDLAAAAADFCQAWEDAPNSFRLFREQLRAARAQIDTVMDQHRIPAEGIRGRFQAAGTALNGLRGIVEADIETAHREGSQPADILLVAAAYRTFADEVERAPRLAAYALAQATSLEAAAESRTVRFSVFLPDDPLLRIDLPRLENAPDTFGYGERWRGRGESASLWIEAGDHRATLLQGSWRERERQLRIEAGETPAAALPLVWDQPIVFGITVVHDRTGERAILPEEDRSLWNPLNYGLFRVEPQDYRLSAFPSLHAMLRELRAQGNDADYAIQLDRLVRRRDPGDAPQWVVRVEDHPPGRDLDWPEVFAPLSTEEAEALGRELRDAVETWLEEGEHPLLDLLP